MRAFSGPVGHMILLAGIGAINPVVRAQEPRRVTSPPAELLAAFTRESTMRPAAQTRASVDITYVISGRASYPTADRDTFLRGLEDLAMSASDSRLRAEAAYSFALAGSRRSTRPMTDVLPRLARIYERSPAARGVIVSAMVEMPDRDAAIRFLEPIAVANPDSADFPGSAYAALVAMTSMGNEGRAALKHLHDTGAVKDPEAKQALKLTAQNGYQK